MASMTYLAENHLLRTLRRYGIDIPLRHRFFTLSASAVLVVATAVGACLGLLVGLPDDPRLARDAVLLSAPVAWALVVTLSSPGRTLRTALDSSRGWALLATASATPREFAYGRYVLPELTKTLIASGAVAGGAWGMVVSDDVKHPDAAGLAAVATVGIALGVAARAAIVLGAPARRLTGMSAWLVRVVVVVAAGLSVAAYALADAFVPTAALILAVGVVLATAVAAYAHRRLGTVEWCDVTTVAMLGQTVRHEAPALPQGRSRTILAVDLRRLLRSADARLRPVVNYVALLAILAIGAGAYALFSGAVSLPPDLPRGELTAGVCAFAGYAASLAAASVLALDADRHAYTLWSLITDALPAVATVRAAIGSVVVSVCGLAAVAAASAALGLGRRDLGLALVAVFVMAALAPVIELAGSLRWPELDWVDATEIGTSSGARYVLGFTVGIPVAAALAIARNTDIAPTTAQLVIAVVALPVLAPLIAATVMNPVTRAVTRRSHA